MADITVTIRFFGAFRKYGDGMSFTLPAGSTAAMVKTVLAEKLSNDQLVRDSALANDNTIIDDATVLVKDSQLAILPPVCGG